MNALITTIVSSISGSLAAILLFACKAFNSFFEYKNSKFNDKQQQKKERKEEKHNKKIDDVIDNGSIEDLLDLKKT